VGLEVDVAAAATQRWTDWCASINVEGCCQLNPLTLRHGPQSLCDVDQVIGERLPKSMASQDRLEALAAAVTR
jgi:hypothetical protein